jgi:predicted porin
MPKRNLLNCLFAASLAIPVPALADNANITFYGVANVSYDLVDTGTSAAGAQGTSVNKVSSNASRFGIKGSEDIGDGLTANWQIESLIALDNAGGTFATRNSFAGLSHKDYGSVLLGRYDTPYKISTRRLDNFSDSIGDNRSLMGSVTGTSASAAFDGRQPDVFAYTTPLMAGFSAAVARVNLAETASTATAAKATATSLAGMYDAGTLYGSLAYETHHLDIVRIGGKESAWKAGLGYTLDDYAFGFAYEKSSDTLGGASAPANCTALSAGSNCLGHSAWYLTGKYTFGSNAVKLAYTKAGNLGSAANTGAKQFALGYDRRTSKRTTLFVVYTRLSNDSKANYGLGNSAFSTAATTSIGAGAAPSALSFGMKHVF